MKRNIVVTGVLLSLAAFGAHAHARLKASTPKEGETVTMMPASITLTFSESARITAVSIRKDQEPKQKLMAPNNTGEQISIAIPMPAVVAGGYTLTWRVASVDDNHIMSGELHFKVAPTRIDRPMKP